MVGLVPGGDGATAGAVSVAAGERCGAPGEKAGKNLERRFFATFLCRAVSSRDYPSRFFRGFLLPLALAIQRSHSQTSAHPPLPCANEPPRSLNSRTELCVS